MERLRKSRLALLLLRILLIAVLLIDAGLVAMIFQHWHSGGGRESRRGLSIRTPRSRRTGGKCPLNNSCATVTGNSRGR